MGDSGDNARVSFSDNETSFIGVKNIEEAERIAKELKGKSFKAIELCGAFGEEGARRIIEATGHSIAVGYVTHFPEDDELFLQTFGK